MSNVYTVTVDNTTKSSLVALYNMVADHVGVPTINSVSNKSQGVDKVNNLLAEHGVTLYDVDGEPTIDTPDVDPADTTPADPEDTPADDQPDTNDEWAAAYGNARGSGLSKCAALRATAQQWDHGRKAYIAGATGYGVNRHTAATQWQQGRAK